MGQADQFTSGARAADLARGAADWLIDGAGMDPRDPSLYHGLAGVVLALQEAHEYFCDERYADAVGSGADALSLQVDSLENCSLYFGLTGVAVALRALGRHEAADRALDRVRQRFDGDAQVFRLLARITRDQAWVDLGDRCWQTVRESGLPRRLRPGFWDNNARCCGTAGVVALGCDRIVEREDDFDFANLLVDDLTARATVDEAGVRWSNHEHRARPSLSASSNLRRHLPVACTGVETPRLSGLNDRAATQVE